MQHFYSKHFGRTLSVNFVFLMLCFAPCIFPLQAQDGSSTMTLKDIVDTALSQNTNIMIAERSVAISEGTWESAASQFDTRLSSSFGMVRENTPLLSSQQIDGVSVLEQEFSSYQIGLFRELKSGISLGSSVSWIRRTDDFTNRTSPNYGEVEFSASVPILQGRGSRLNAATEKAAELSFHGSRFDLTQTTSYITLQTVQAYWSYLAAVERLDILMNSEARAEKILEDMRVLVDAGERPSADLKQPQANLSDRRSSRISAEQTVLSNKQNLGIILGFSQAEVDRLQIASRSFPEAEEFWTQHLEDEMPYIEMAFRNRADLNAAGKDVQAAKVLVESALGNLRPELDLTLTAGYSGLDEGTTANQYITPFRQNLTGANLSASLTFTLPTGSRRASLLQQEAIYEQSELSRVDLQRRIKSDVKVAVSDVRRNIARLQEVQNALAMYQSAVESEQKKLQQNLSTIIDLIFVEDRLTSSYLNELTARQQLANAIVYLRFQTGTLIEATADSPEINIENLITLPSE